MLLHFASRDSVPCSYISPTSPCRSSCQFFILLCTWDFSDGQNGKPKLPKDLRLSRDRRDPISTVRCDSKSQHLNLRYKSTREPGTASGESMPLQTAGRPTTEEKAPTRLGILAYKQKAKSPHLTYNYNNCSSLNLLTDRTRLILNFGFSSGF